MAAQKGSPLVAVLPLRDGRVILTRSILGRDQLVVIAPAKDPVPFVASDEETSRPLALVGEDKVAFIEGTGARKRVALATIVDGRIVRRLDGIDGLSIQALATTPAGDTLFFVSSRTVFALSLTKNEASTTIRAGDGVAVDPTGKYLVILLNETSGVRLVHRSIVDGREEPVRLPAEPRLAPIAWGSNTIGPDGRLGLRLALRDSWFWPAAVFDPATGHVDPIPGGDQADMVRRSAAGQIKRFSWPLSSSDGGMFPRWPASSASTHCGRQFNLAWRGARQPDLISGSSTHLNPHLRRIRVIAGKCPVRGYDVDVEIPDRRGHRHLESARCRYSDREPRARAGPVSPMGASGSAHASAHDLAQRDQRQRLEYEVQLGIFSNRHVIRVCEPNLGEVTGFGRRHQAGTCPTVVRLTRGCCIGRPHQ